MNNSYKLQTDTYSIVILNHLEKMEEYDKTLLRLEDISFNEIGEWKKTARETSDYLSNGCCIEYLTLILKASLFRSEKHMLEGNCLPADDTIKLQDKGMLTAALLLPFRCCI